MRLLQISLLALASEVVYGYLDTSPFFMFSTSELLLPNDQLLSGLQLTSALVSALSQCPSDIYLLIKQAGVRVSDFSSSTSAPTLSSLLDRSTHSTIRSSLTIPEVLGDIDIDILERELRGKCGAWTTPVEDAGMDSSPSFDQSRHVLTLDFPSISKSQPERGQDLLEHDRSLASVLDMLSNRNYTVMYMTTADFITDDLPAKANQYEMNNYDQPLQSDLKRDVRPAIIKRQSNLTLVDGPLFERYQFLSPGLFMSLLVSFLLLSILYVAISAISSLQVSYAAFDKDSNPSAQKKAQ